MSMHLTSGASEQDFLEEADFCLFDVTTVVDHLILSTGVSTIGIFFLEKTCSDLLLVDTGFLQCEAELFCCCSCLLRGSFHRFILRYLDLGLQHVTSLDHSLEL